MQIHVEGLMKTKVGRLSHQWTSKTNIPFAVLGIAYLVLYSIQVVQSENVILYRQLDVIGNAIWVVFVIDLIIRLLGAESLKKFIKSNLIEILAVTLPFLRVLRIFRVLLAFKGIKYFVVDRAHATGLYVAILAPFTWFAGAIVVLDAESANSNASINTLGEALWWSLSTITTVGYGDLYPSTTSGKFVAAVLMITGISIFSAGAGIFANWIMAGKRTN